MLRLLGRRGAGWLLCAPALAILTVAFGWPMLMLFRMSLKTTDSDGALVTGVSMSTYAGLAANGETWLLSLDSLRLAAVSATVALLLCYPMALMLFRTRSRFRALLAVAALAPLLVSGTVRVIGWLALLGDVGVVNSGLRWVELTPVALINNWTGVQIGQSESVMPYTVLALLASFGQLDARLEEAAATLGAGPLRTFWIVTVPLTLPAALGAWLLAFVLGVSAFVSPKLMGGGRVFLLSTHIYDAATQTLDWPVASALSVFVLLMLVLFLLAQSSLNRLTTS